MSTDFSGMIAFAQSLAETVKQAQTATEALAAREADLVDANRALTIVQQQRDGYAADAERTHNTVTELLAKLAASEARNAEVSEALAAAKAKLNSFRQLLGVDDGSSAPVPTPAVLPEQPTNPVTEPPHEAQPVDPAPAGGTGGMEPHDPAPVERYPAPMSYRDADDPAGEPFKSDPSPAPEVAEPRPTPPEPSHPISDHSGDDRFGQAQEAAPSGERGPLSWRDSTSHVPYRAFNF